MTATYFVNLTMPITYQVVFYVDPDSKINVTSVVPIENYPKWIRFVVGMPSVWLIAFGCATIMLGICMFVPYIFISIFLTSETK